MNIRLTLIEVLDTLVDALENGDLRGPSPGIVGDTVRADHAEHELRRRLRAEGR